MTIYDLARLTESEAVPRIEQTLDTFPELKRLYDDAFVGKLARQRHIDNHLLWLLVQNEQYATDYFRAVVDDLLLLELAGSYTVFTSKLKATERFAFEAARSELGLAAWMNRRGYDVTLEPETRNGRNCDFNATTVPQTWWEIKAVQNLDFFLKDEEVAREVQHRLTRISEPYVLSLQPSTIDRGEVAAAATDLRKQLHDYYASNGVLPHTFEAQGLRIEAAATTQPEGYLGSEVTRVYSWTNQICSKICDRVVSAVRQLPDAAAGVVVIDSSLSSWTENHEVEDACFGPEVLRGNASGCWTERRTAEGAFQPTQRTRISAVVHYDRGPWIHDGPYQVFVVHNPFAAIPLADDVFAGPYTRQARMADNGGGRYHLEYTPA